MRHQEAGDAASAEPGAAGSPREMSAFAAAPVHVGPQRAGGPNSNKLTYPPPSPLSQGPGPSNNIFLKGDASVFNLALCGRCVLAWLPEASLSCTLPACGRFPFWESDRPCSTVQPPLLSPPAPLETH